MTASLTVDQQVSALEDGRAFVDRSHFRKIEVAGTEAERWLNDLVTAGVARLAAGEARRSLLLTPTGRIRADFNVMRTEEAFMLVQDPSQPRALDDLLAPYVLSSDVELRDRTSELSLFCLPGRTDAAARGQLFRPSMLGVGVDLLMHREAGEKAQVNLGGSLVVATEEAVDVWRVRRGLAGFPIDLNEDSLPAEGGLEATIDFSKGCFLGQEAVAKVRNLGHPTRVVLALRADGRAAAGEPVHADRREVGTITSAVPDGEGTAILARVRWDARSGPLTVGIGGIPLSVPEAIA